MKTYEIFDLLTRMTIQKMHSIVLTIHTSLPICGEAISAQLPSNFMIYEITYNLNGCQFVAPYRHIEKSTHHRLGLEYGFEVEETRNQIDAIVT